MRWRINCRRCGGGYEEADTPHVIWLGEPRSPDAQGLVVECPTCGEIWAVDLSRVRVEPQTE